MPSQEKSLRSCRATAVSSSFAPLEPSLSTRGRRRHVFLNEIGDLSFSSRGQLLRLLLEGGVYFGLGSDLAKRSLGCPHRRGDKPGPQGRPGLGKIQEGHPLPTVAASRSQSASQGAGRGPAGAAGPLAGKSGREPWPGDAGSASRSRRTSCVLSFPRNVRELEAMF
jgi:hypothetical protein